nr:MAG TPA: hypothetical protein [Caudoviricetes sp.]
MENLIKDIQREWLRVKSDAARRCERAGQHEMAAKLAACQMFTGIETLPELVDKMFSPQGREFMTAFGFPDVETCRRFIPYHPEQYGVFIDAREIAVNDPKRVWLIGNTSARITCAKTQGNTIVVMHGATADITAAGYSVVKIESDKRSNANVTIADHAVVNR